MNFYIKNIKPYYNTPEWGFPKGRKSKGESDLECAVREFTEETGYSQHDIKILSNIKPIVENIIGTNGISYRHIYFLAEDISDNVPKISDGNSNEIGNIGYFTFEDSYQLLREYHVEKRLIIKNVFMYFINKLTETEDSESSEEKQNEKICEKNNAIPHVQSWSVELDDVLFNTK